MFMVTDSEAAIVWQAYKEGGEAKAISALRRTFPFLSLDDEEKALQWVRTISGWGTPEASKGHD